jgi:undecaprenyl-diphosphatase
MLEAVVLGIVQGITEWLPVSSEGVLVLVKLHVFQNGLELADLVRYAVFLHMGTFFAALVYLRKEVVSIFSTLASYQKASVQEKNLLWFLVVSSLVSGIIGVFLFFALEQLQEQIIAASKEITLGIGLLLLFTAFTQFRKVQGRKKEGEVQVRTGIILGIVQGFSLLPGLSRSGLTVSALLLSGFTKEAALRLSFLMSLPAILGGNIFFAREGLSVGQGELVAVLFAFVFGLVTMKGLFLLANKVHFGWFVLVFALITVLAVFL